MKNKIITVLHKATIYPISIAHYLITAGHPIYPNWMIRLDNWFITHGSNLKGG